MQEFLLPVELLLLHFENLKLLVSLLLKVGRPLEVLAPGFFAFLNAVLNLDNCVHEVLSLVVIGTQNTKRRVIV